MNATTDSLFDTDHYPVDQPESVAYQTLLRNAQRELQTRNCARLPDFVQPDALTEMQREAASLAPHATFTKKNLNPYFSTPPENTPADHPLRRFAPRRHGMIRGDRFSREGLIWAAFQNGDLRAFVAHCLGYSELHTYRDPYGCVNVNVQPAGCEFAWHFDHNDFTVSIGLKQPAQGGCFEYVPDIRTPGHEHYDAVQRVLDGDREDVRTLVLRPGDLQLFKGGNTLHRVTAPIGEDRHSLLLSYVTDPSRIATHEYAQRVWGEAHPLHRE